MNLTGYTPQIIEPLTGETEAQTVERACGLVRSGGITGDSSYGPGFTGMGGPKTLIGICRQNDWGDTSLNGVTLPAGSVFAIQARPGDYALKIATGTATNIDGDDYAQFLQGVDGFDGIPNWLCGHIEYQPPYALAFMLMPLATKP